MKNIHERVWGHLKTPFEDSNGLWNFPKNAFSNCGFPEDIVSQVTLGRIKVAAFEVKPSEFSSLIEVYFQSLHYKNNGIIPVLNKKIG